MPNEQYQSLFGASEEVVRATLLDGCREGCADALEQLLDGYPETVGPLVRDLGGHDLADVLDALRQARESPDRPTVIFAYTIKGYGLEIAGRPQNHSALLTRRRSTRLRAETGLTPETEWDAFGDDTREGALLAAARRRLDRRPRPPATQVEVPTTLSQRRSGQDVDPGGVRADAARPLARRGRRRATRHGRSGRLRRPPTSAASSTRPGSGARTRQPVYDAMEDSPLNWRVGPGGQHIEMGIAEMNLVLLLGQLGLTWDCSASASSRSERSTTRS